MSFQELIAIAEPLEGGFALDVPESWAQGRTTYGGLTAALGHEAARQLAPDLPVLRSAHVSFVGPVSGKVEARARLLRRGRNASWVVSEITGEKGTCFIATFVFMSAMDSRIHLNENPFPDNAVAVEDATPFDNPNAPNFVREHFEVRFGQEKMLSKEAEISWWARLRERDGVDPMSEILLIGDVLPPGIMPLTGFGTPVSSMQWQVNLYTGAPQSRDGWWLLRSHADYAENGCSSQKMMMWNAEGEPIASGMQSVAVFA